MPPDSQKTTSQPVPPWLDRLVKWGFAGLVATIAGLALALSLGLADPRPVGQITWFDHFESSQTAWQHRSGPLPEFQPETLAITSTAAGDLLLLTRPKTAADFTFEVAARQAAGPPGAAYGLAFGIATNNGEIAYTTILINNNGFLTAYRQADGTRTTYWPAQEWPHILLGEQANRLRIDVRDGLAEVRINDEFFIAIPALPGDIGLLVDYTAVNQTIHYGWARLWE